MFILLSVSVGLNVHQMETIGKQNVEVAYYQLKAKSFAYIAVSILKQHQKRVKYCPRYPA